MAKTLVTLNTSPAFTLVTLNTSPSWSGVALPTTPTWKLPGSWPDMTVNDWEDETRTWQQIGLLGKDSD
jgi:hypothetical protein